MPKIYHVLKMNPFVFCAIFIISLSSCTGGGDSKSSNLIGAPVKDIIDGVTDNNPEVKKINEDVAKISQDMNRDPLYALSVEDQNTLLEEGVAEASDVAEWVK